MRIKTTYRKEILPKPEPYDKVDVNAEINSAQKRRMMLNECVDEIYMINKRLAPILPPAFDGLRVKAKRNVNFLLKGRPLSVMERKRMNVKRQLFRVQNRRMRKQLKPSKRKTPFTKIFNQKGKNRAPYKTRKKIPRNLWKYVEENITAEMQQKILRAKGLGNCHCNRKAKNLDNMIIDVETVDEKVVVNKEAGILADKEVSDEYDDEETDDCEEGYDDDDEYDDDYFDVEEIEEPLTPDEEFIARTYPDYLFLNEELMEETLRTLYYVRCLGCIMIAQ